MNGIERPARRGDEAVRTVANAMLWPFRLVIDLIFLATGTAGGLLENEQIVPRARDFFFTRGGELGIFPTVFVETGTNPNIGARLIASIEPYAATVRAGLRRARRKCRRSPHAARRFVGTSHGVFARRTPRLAHRPRLPRPRPNAPTPIRATSFCSARRRACTANAASASSPASAFVPCPISSS